MGIQNLIAPASPYISYSTMHRFVTALMLVASFLAHAEGKNGRNNQAKIQARCARSIRSTYQPFEKQQDNGGKPTFDEPTDRSYLVIDQTTDDFFEIVSQSGSKYSCAYEQFTPEP